MHRIFIVRYGSQKPEGVTVQGLSVLCGLIFRVAFLLMLHVFPTILINQCLSFGQFRFSVTLDLSWLLHNYVFQM